MKNIYEINTAVWLSRLSEAYSKPITLANVPDETLDRIVSFGMDTVWLMGVWERSPIAAEISRRDESLRQEIAATLPDMTDENIIGSAYAVKSYTVDPRFGGANELAQLRQRLKERGLKLLLDFVPNHSAFDHTWTTEHPEYYITSKNSEAASSPSNFYKVGDLSIAKGKDPNLDPWPDVAQLNAFSEVYREASIETLLAIAKMCDGVRCDMAMLLLNESFTGTWESLAGEPLAEEYWKKVISAVKDKQPNLTFIAETYWQKERQLLELGFDYCYNKDLYDHLIAQNEAALESHVAETQDIADHLVHFLENHDEARVATLLSLEKHENAVRIITSQPGLHLWHDGQFEGYRHKLPVHIARGPIEYIDPQVYDIYRRLLTPNH